jgi:hypothetical protein
MSTVGLTGTSATLMWVAEHSSKVNATKRERMEEADARAKQVEGLNLIKEKLSAAKQSGDPASIQQAKEAMDNFLAAHDGDENIDDLTKQIDAIKQGLDGLVAPDKEPELAENATPEQTTAFNGAHAAWEKNKAKWDKGIEDRTKSLDDLAQSIGQRDQIEMMRITTLDQSENRFYELGSNKIANDGKTANALIGNIRV